MSYKMTHPNGGEVQVNADQVAMYESQGWETDPNAKAPEVDKPKGNAKNG